MATYVKFNEYNDHEGEEWTFWLQKDGNEVALSALEAVLNAYSEDRYELEIDDILTEPEVDLLVKYSSSGYYADHNKVPGRLTLPDDFAIDGDNDPLYKGGITEMFSSSDA